MASATIRSTYALDAETVERLERLARQWSVSKSEALRRAIRSADRQPTTEAKLAALDDLQTSLGLTDRRAEDWSRRVQHERTKIGR
jgi:predicted transcriptional regulator